ncbi:hypothetical protein CASFOL_032791 [Castilleja foliolosa]|uniref:CCR4-NOT transcription complex subunit 10 n=1 Tax=Castilleja foliolosa TaxID=1961234 RepID=A0ABD3C2H4_9LAMI
MVEDDVVAGLATEATKLFKGGKFGDCLRSLHELLQKKKNDPKVRHNIAIAEIFQDGCSDPKRLIEALGNIQGIFLPFITSGEHNNSPSHFFWKQCEELNHTSGEHLEASSNDGRKLMAGMKGTNNSPHQFSSSSVVCSNEFDPYVAIFNIAFVWFHLHNYAESFSYLDTLYQNIEPIDEVTALRICLLLLDVALLSHHASRSADVISYMEKILHVYSLTSQIENGTAAQQQSSLVFKSASLPSNPTTADSSHSDSVVAANTLENPLSRTLSEEALEDESLQLLSSLDISGQQNLQRLSGIASSNDLLRGQAKESLSPVDLRLKLHLYKVRFFLLTRNHKAAKREVKMAMNLAHGKVYPLALYLKSRLEYSRRNHDKAIKLLNASGNHTETDIFSMYYNNLGCINFQMGKHHTSGVYFHKALKNCSLSRKEKPLKFLTMSQDKSLLITYNCGMYSFACGRPLSAVHCFEMANSVFYDRPLMWLRIAECCLMALEKELKTFDSSAIGVTVIGKGKWRYLALNGNSSNGQSGHVKKDDSSAGDAKKPELSLTRARQCLVKALCLLNSYQAKYSSSDSIPSVESKELGETTFTNHQNGGDPKEPNVSSGSSQVNSNGEGTEQKSGNNHSASSLQSSITDYENICMKENHMMKQAVLADLAYVDLTLEDPLIALTAAKSLLELPECSKIYIFLGTMYAAEALLLLNQPKQAAEHLMKYISSSGNDVEFPYNREDCEKWEGKKLVDNDDSKGGPITSSPDKSQASSLFSSPEEVRGTIRANLAANFALMGELEQAEQYLKKALSDIPKSRKAILTGIYLDVKLGKKEEALKKLRQHGGFTKFLPR